MHTRAISWANSHGHACLLAQLIALVCAAFFVSKVPRETVSKISIVFNIFCLARRKSHVCAERELCAQRLNKLANGNENTAFQKWRLHMTLWMTCCWKTDWFKCGRIIGVYTMFFLPHTRSLESTLKNCISRMRG